MKNPHKSFYLGQKTRTMFWSTTKTHRYMAFLPRKVQYARAMEERAKAKVKAEKDKAKTSKKVKTP